MNEELTGLSARNLMRPDWCLIFITHSNEVLRTTRNLLPVFFGFICDRHIPILIRMQVTYILGLQKFQPFLAILQGCFNYLLVVACLLFIYGFVSKALPLFLQYKYITTIKPLGILSKKKNKTSIWHEDVHEPTCLQSYNLCCI